MLTQEKICQIVHEIAPQYGISQIYLFGSYARGDATELSDVDIRVVGGNIPSLFELGGLYEDLIDALGKSVDIVMTDSMKADFYNMIKDDEVLIYGGLQ